MRKLLKKEMKLAASPLSYIFIAFGLMAFFAGLSYIGRLIFRLPWAVSVVSMYERIERHYLYCSFACR